MAQKRRSRGNISCVHVERKCALLEHRQVLSQKQDKDFQGCSAVIKERTKPRSVSYSGIQVVLVRLNHFKQQVNSKGHIVISLIIKQAEVFNKY